MKNKTPYVHRDISWLSFNYRVLQEAKDPSVPLFEKIKFLAIYSSNLGEFYRVRVSNHKNLIRAGKKTVRNVEFQPKEIVKEIMSLVEKQQEEFSHIFQNLIIPGLEKEGVVIKRLNTLTTEQIDFVTTYFSENLIPYIVPILLKEDRVKPFLQNGALYLGVHMKSKGLKDKGKKYYALLKVPSDTQERFVTLPSDTGHELIILDDLVRHIIPKIFPGFKILGSYSIKLTRDAELYIDDEYQGDLIQKIKKGLIKRDKGPAARLVYDREMPKDFINYLKSVFSISSQDLLPEGRYHNNFEFINFPKFDKGHLTDIGIPPIHYTPLHDSKDFFETLRERDHMLYFPYHKYDSVVKFFEEAAVDEHVTHIKIIQYRVAKHSKIMDAIIKAVKNKKQVVAFIEIKARFDEEANLNWGEKLESKGVKVFYSMPGLKVHSKLAMVRRLVNGKEEHYGYLSTGNFHEKTAELYTDFGLFTYEKKIMEEVKRIFKYLETKQKPLVPFKHLGVGTFNLKEKLKDLIHREIEIARKGKEAYITIKMNSLQDKEMINLLYKASQVGVRINMIVRGICCLIPGVKGISENIKGISIVDRYLEHARVFIFGNNSDEKIYLSSADWMVRNLHHRVETMFPIFDKELKQFVRNIIMIQLNDNVKSRVIDGSHKNLYKRNDNQSIRSQYDIYYYIKSRTY